MAKPNDTLPIKQADTNEPDGFRDRGSRDHNERPTIENVDYKGFILIRPNGRGTAISVEVSNMRTVLLELMGTGEGVSMTTRVQNARSDASPNGSVQVDRDTPITTATLQEFRTAAQRMGIAYHIPGEATFTPPPGYVPPPITTPAPPPPPTPVRPRKGPEW